MLDFSCSLVFPLVSRAAAIRLYQSRNDNKIRRRQDFVEKRVFLYTYRYLDRYMTTDDCYVTDE